MAACHMVAAFNQKHFDVWKKWQVGVLFLCDVYVARACVFGKICFNT
jgi:hypothetical protein